MSHVDGVDDGKVYSVSGRIPSGYGVSGRSPSGYGVIGESDSGYGVIGISHSLDIHGAGVAGSSSGGPGVIGSSNSGNGVSGNSISGYGVYGASDVVGVYGLSPSGYGVFGLTRSGTAVWGESDSGAGVFGSSHSWAGVVGSSGGGPGVIGGSNIGAGVYGYSSYSNGVYGHSYSGAGVYGNSDIGYAAYLDGRVFILGPLEKPGGSFKIDHPLDPANKYFHHSFVESPDMKNVYDDVVILDDTGKAEIDLPDWFGALNKDFRYQLTAIGAPGPNLYIAEEVSETTTNYTSNSSTKTSNSHFKIAGGTSGMKVSWQVTGIRKDPWANAHRIQVEEDKPDKERGYYMYPDLYGQPAEKGISRLLFPEEVEEPLVK